MERGRGDQVVVEPIEPIGQIVDERALDLDQVRERVDQSLGVIAGVRARALGEQDADQRTRPLPFRGRGKGRGGHLVGGVPGMGRPAQDLRDDPRQRLRAALLRGPLGHVGPGAMSTRDVARIGQTSIDRPDGIGVHSQCGPKLPDGGESRARQQSTGVDLVGELPVDLRRDRDVRVPLDVKVARRRSGHIRGADLVCHSQLVQVS